MTKGAVTLAMSIANLQSLGPSYNILQLHCATKLRGHVALAICEVPVGNLGVKPMAQNSTD